jgi:ferric-dicitrate binding protein FerR (iron transport regulator)
MKTQDHIPDHLFAKFFSGEISDSEKHELDTFISQSPEHKAIFDDYQMIWETKSMEDKFTAKTETALLKVKQSVGQQKKSIRPNYIRFMLRTAAAIIILIGLSYTGYELFYEKGQVYLTLESKDKVIKQVLSDGSIIWLNKNSLLEYPEEFEKDGRQVFLKGEAYFIISHDPKKRFTVETESVKTEVLGTEFNLKSMASDNEIELILVKGKVKFTDEKTKDAEILIQNEALTLDKTNRKILKSKVESDNFLSWKTNQIDLDGLNLEQVSKDLTNYFKREIVADDEIKDTVFRHTLPFKDPNLEEILNTIKFSLNLTVDSTDEKIVIKKEN